MIPQKIFTASLVEEDGSLTAVIPMVLNPRYIGFDKPDPEKAEATMWGSDNPKEIADAGANRMYARVASSITVTIEDGSKVTGTIFTRVW